MQYPHLLLFGTTGRAGQQLLKQALNTGYKVTAVVRDTNKVNVKHPQLTIVSGDIADEKSINQVFEQQRQNGSMFDAVLSTLGIFQREEGTPLADGTRPILENMKKHKVKRMVVMSSIGVGDSKGQGSLLVKTLVRFLLRFVIKDKNKQETMIANSNLDWTVIRPPQIIPGDETGEYYLWSGKHDKKKISWKVSQGDAAHAMLRQLENSDSFGKAYQLSYLK